METRAANAFKLSLEGGDLVLEFGNVVRNGASSGPAAVAVTDRITLPLDIGRRLAIGLDECLQPHAAALRAEEAKALPPAEAAVAARPGAAPVRPPSEEAGERAAQLLRMVGNLGVPYLYERSFRMCDRALLANRFLLTLDTLDIPGEPRRRGCSKSAIAWRCRSAARQEAQANFAMAKCVHFGFEADGHRLHLQALSWSAGFRTRRRRGRAQSRTPVLLHLAFKWDLAAGAAVTSRYWWRPRALRRRDRGEVGA